MNKHEYMVDLAKSLNAGDLVEVTHEDWPAGTLLRGPVYEEESRCTGKVYKRVGFHYLVEALEDDPDYSVTVVFRAPKPFYVNHGRLHPVPDDVMKLDGELLFHDRHGDWHAADHVYTKDSQLPEGPRVLLVDGDTKEIVK